MTILEKKFITYVEKYLLPIAVIVMTILALAIRVCLFDFVSGDMGDFLLPWYNEIKEAGGVWALDRRVGNYNILYQFVIAIMTYVSIDPVWGYKIFSIIFDFLLAGIIGVIVYDCCMNFKEIKAIIAYVAVLFSPLVIMNSSLWGQCDAIYTFFCVFAVWAYMKERKNLAFILLGISFAFKLQTLFILPLFVFIYVYKKNISIFHFMIIPIMLLVSSIPGLIMGRGIKECFRIYISQTDYYKVMWVNYPSAWCILSVGNTEEFYDLMKMPAIILTLVVLGVLVLYWWNKKIAITKENVIYMSFLIVYTCVLFLPAMHERYGFIYEILGIVIFFLIPKTLPLLIGLNLVILPLYSQFLFGPLIELPILGTINVFIFSIYLLILNREICGNNSKIL